VSTVNDCCFTLRRALTPELISAPRPLCHVHVQQVKDQLADAAPLLAQPDVTAMRTGFNLNTELAKTSALRTELPPETFNREDADEAGLFNQFYLLNAPNAFK
jgi:hypothetical protein